MQIENDEILCIPGREKHFAIEYPYIQELCSGLKISRFPCLPPSFAGLINYKGNIIPLIILEESKTSGTARLTLIIRGKKHLAGILLDTEPYIVRRGNAPLIEMFPETENISFWKVKGGVKLGEEIFQLIDVEKTVDDLMDFS